MKALNYKRITLMILAIASLYSATVVGPVCLLHASSDQAKKGQRSGLALNMIISADELRAKQLKKNNIIIFDARSEKSYEESHLQEAVLPRTADYYQQEKLYKKQMTSRAPDPDKALAENMRKYSKDALIVTYCSSGGCQASAVLALEIKRLGFKDVRAMEDGIQTWSQKGYPIESGRQK